MDLNYLQEINHNKNKCYFHYRFCDLALHSKYLPIYPNDRIITSSPSWKSLYTSIFHPILRDTPSPKFQAESPTSSPRPSSFRQSLSYVSSSSQRNQCCHNLLPFPSCWPSNFKSNLTVVSLSSTFWTQYTLSTST